MKIAILGGGNIGEAFARCVIDREVASASSVLVIEIDGGRADKIHRELQCKTATGYEGIAEYDVLLIAVKPQDFAAAADKISPLLRASQIVISAMAGITISRIESALKNTQKIVRCMPNLPIVIGEGSIAYVASGSVTDPERSMAEKVLGSGGLVVPLKDESLLDAVTALSGSGPAYVYYALEQVITAGRELGLSEEQARALIFSTVRGALNLADAKPHSLSALRSAVTSKGGTTAAALEVFEKGRLDATIKEGILKASARAKELANAK